MTEPTMMEAAATTTEGASPSSVHDTVAATADKLYGDTKATATQGQQAAEAAPAGKEPAPADAAKTEASAEAKAAPETYEFKAPEGRVFDSEVIAEYSKVAKELNLSQEAAQRVLDAVGPKLAERQAAQVEAVRNGWADNSKADKSLELATYAPTLEVMLQRCISEYATQQKALAARRAAGLPDEEED